MTQESEGDDVDDVRVDQLERLMQVRGVVRLWVPSVLSSYC